MLDPASMNPAQIETELMRYVGLLEKATQECRRRGMTCAAADADFRTAYARAMVAADHDSTVKVTVSEREAHAALATQAEYRAKREAEELLSAARSASANLREMIGALRTINTNARALMAVS